MLLQKEDEFSILKKIEKRKKVKAVFEEEAKEKEKAKENLKMKLFSLNGECLFKHERQDGKIDCAKDFREKDVIRVYAKDHCSECWNKAIHVPMEKDN